jgi:Holliday junction DNA helicase RuvA
MIAQIGGKIIQKKNNCVVLENQGICYEVLIPSIIMSRIDEYSQDGQIRFVTYHYHHLEPSKSIPILIGFINEIEKEFFELFITVSGIGPRAALKALNKPISVIAKGINDADAALLCSLPGIGKQRAKEIIAKLQGKMGKFGLIQDAKEKIATQIAEDVKKEALEVLSQLQYKKQEAKEMIEKALERCPNINNTEELLNEVYRQKVK